MEFSLYVVINRCLIYKQHPELCPNSDQNFNSWFILDALMLVINTIEMITFFLG